MYKNSVTCPKFGLSKNLLRLSYRLFLVQFGDNFLEIISACFEYFNILSTFMDTFLSSIFLNLRGFYPINCKILKNLHKQKNLQVTKIPQFYF